MNEPRRLLDLFQGFRLNATAMFGMPRDTLFLPDGGMIRRFFR